VKGPENAHLVKTVQEANPSRLPVPITELENPDATFQRESSPLVVN
jgi:hypothetical protein